MRVEVDLDLCQGYGVCAQIAPEVFGLDDDGYAILLGDGDVPDGLDEKVQEAAGACPVRAVLATSA